MSLKKNWRCRFKGGYMKNTKIMRNIRNLIVEHPELPIYFFVDGDVVADNSYCDWFAEAYAVAVDKIYEGKCRMWSLSDVIDDIDYFLEDELPDHLLTEWEDLTDDEYRKKGKEWIDALPWVECILIRLGIPSNL